MGYFFVCQAARDGRADVIEHKVQKLGEDRAKLLNKRDEANNTPLHYAVRYGHVNIVKLLTEFGAGEEVKHFIILSLALVISVLVAHKVKVDQYFIIDIFTGIRERGEHGALPLHYAARFHTNTVRQPGSRYSSNDDVADGEINTVFAPVTTALSTDEFGGDVNPSHEMQVRGTNFIIGLLLLL